MLFWNRKTDNLYLPKHECDFMGKLIKVDIGQAKKFHGTFLFIDDLCALRDFQKLYKEIYHKGTGTRFGTFWITCYFSWFGIHYISNGEISTKWKLSFFTVWMPNIHCKIPSFVFYGTVMSEILCISISSSSVTSFYEKTVH